MLFKASEQWTLAADIGASRGAEPGGRRTEKFALLGAIFHVNDKTDLDIGWRRSLGSKPVSNTVGVGLALRW